MSKKPKLDRIQSNVHKNFPDGHWLSDPKHVYQFILWNTFYRRNLHRFAIDYLGLKLHLYQIIILWAMGRSRVIVAIASRAAAKSFVIAIYACCRAILRPGSRIVLTSATRGQSQLIVSEKIKKDLWDMSPMLRREIDRISDNTNNVYARLKNNSIVITVTLSRNSRGNRSNVNVGEEAREIDLPLYNEIVSPFLVVRQAPFMLLSEYDGDSRLQEEPCEIFISSSIDDTHWLYQRGKSTLEHMLEDDAYFFIALDYAVTLKHGIRTRQQLIEQKRKTDPITWMIEYENLVLRSDSRAYFPYELLKDNQNLQRAFYPRRSEDVVNRVKNKYALQKQSGEVRIVSCDIAAIDRSGNDNSSFSCLRLFEESTIVDGRKIRDYRVQIPYIEAIKGQEMRRQAIRIRQLYTDFDADYIVLDIRNMGISIYDFLARVLYDDERGVEYPPLTCMNDDAIASRVYSPGAEPKIFVIAASAKLNNDIAVNFKSMLMEKKIDLLVPKDDGIEEISKFVPGYTNMHPDDQVFFERPYIETMLAINETINLVYEKMQSTGLIRISEQGRNTKDRYTSISYGCYFVSQLARDFLNDRNETEFSTAPTLVSVL